MHLTDEELLAEHKEEQRQKREDERLRAERKHELWKQFLSNDGSLLLGGAVLGLAVGIVGTAIVLHVADTDDEEKIESLERDISWCKEANRRLSESAK